MEIWFGPLKMHAKCFPVEHSSFHSSSTITLHFGAYQENQLKTPAVKHFLISEQLNSQISPPNDHTLQIPLAALRKLYYTQNSSRKNKGTKSYKNLDKYTIPGSREINIILKRILSNFYVRLLLAK